MRIRLLLIASLLLAACGDDSGTADPSAQSPDAAVQEDAATEDSIAAEPDSGPDGPAATDGPADSPHESSLDPAEIDLISSGGENDPMQIVTVDTVEGDELLHRTSTEVDPLDPMVQLLIKRMRRTLGVQLGGVGLAAPQVGISRRLFLAKRTDQTGAPVVAFLNPDITEYGPETEIATEGCLSSPGQPVDMTRSKWVTIAWQSESGEFVPGETIGSATDSKAAYAARIVQHEYDHLDGVLIVDNKQ